MSTRINTVKKLIRNNLISNIGVEVGVWEGALTAAILCEFGKLTIIGVDPYKHYEHYHTYHRSSFETQHKWDLLYDNVKEKLKVFNNRAILCRCTSEEAARIFPDNYFDFVFIDGNHGYEYVRTDIECWKNKVRKNGILIGHDIHSNKDGKDCVKRAVSYHFDNYMTDDECWYVRL